ncbi:MAG TPA: PAC2 family protein [Gaiellaceae bacterium]|nr:PAC2 family protein [Gaiellaceae bacterium]
MSELIVSSRPDLRRPVLLAGFRGWNDGGQGATLGAGYLARQWGAEEFAEIDPENFYDFQAVRPQVSLEDGLTRKLEWPANTFFHAPIPGLDRDVVILLGVEPNLRWKTYSRLVVELTRDLGVELVATFGSLLADVPHTRPAPVSAAASDTSLVEELGVEPSRYEGPTGIVGVLLDDFRRAGVPSVSLWAAVPHYVSLAPSPRAALALCRRFGELLGVDIDLAELETASEEYSEQVTEAVASDAETASYVEELERRVDLMEAAEDLPSGDSLAAELTRFLREREQNGDDESAGGPAS